MITNSKDYYWFFENALSNETCNKIIKIGTSKKIDLGRIHSFDKNDFKNLNKNQKSNMKKIRNSHVTFLNDKWLHKTLNQYVFLANKNSKWNYQIDYSEPVQFSKYKKNQHYDFHSDSSSTDLDQFNKIRKLSLVVCLSDSKKYEGGDFEFQFRNNTDPKIITPVPILKKQGTVIVFPSYLYHRVKPIIKGTRYSLVMWARGNLYW